MVNLGGKNSVAAHAGTSFASSPRAGADTGASGEDDDRGKTTRNARRGDEGRERPSTDRIRRATGDGWIPTRSFPVAVVRACGSLARVMVFDEFLGHRFAREKDAPRYLVCGRTRLFVDRRAISQITRENFQNASVRSCKPNTYEIVWIKYGIFPHLKTLSLRWSAAAVMDSERPRFMSEPPLFPLNQETRV